MKEEARIFVSKCNPDICIGVIVRGIGVDGVVSGKNCREACSQLSEKGYLGELRYFIGDCSCGLVESPISTPYIENLLRVLDRDVGLWYKITVELLKNRDNE